MYLQVTICSFGISFVLLLCIQCLLLITRHGRHYPQFICRSVSYCINLPSLNNSPCATGTLADMDSTTNAKGFLAFMRLIGTTYFKKHATGFDTSSPSSHFLKFCDSSLTENQHHSVWLEDIRQNIWHRIKYENEQIPSDESLWLHWKRSCWVSNMWEQADKNVMDIGEVSDFGWTVKNNTLSVVWDSQSNVMSIRQRVGALLWGCKCITGCTTGRCGCRKKQQYCMEGCECKNCTNLESSVLTTAQPLVPSTTNQSSTQKQ